MTAAEDRAALLHAARVYLREARARRHQRGFAALLIAWAGAARRAARSATRPPSQMELDL